MENVFPCCAGLDVHKESVEACVRRIEPNGRLHQETQHWGTMTRDLLAMADWMTAHGATHVAMESTGVFWKPIYNILESRFTMLLVNARHLKQVPGRKSDVRDCQWIAQLLQYGLLKGSFIPPRSQRELRDLTRHRTQLVEEKARTANRIHKVLQFLQRTYKVFPSSLGHPAPDGMHFVLNLLLFFVVATIALGLWETTRRSARPTA